MYITSAPSSVVHSSQYQTVTQSSHTREPEDRIEPIVDDRISVPFGSRYGESSHLHLSKTSGNHINATV